MHQGTAERLASLYLKIKRRVISEGFGDDIDWQAGCALDSLTESTFLREAAWVVLSAGISEAVVRRCFKGITTAFMEWESAALISENRDLCFRAAMEVFAHAGKISAIAEIADYVHARGLEAVKRDLEENGPDALRELSWMGPITACHLAKNVGLDVAKPDRHLVRIAQAVGASSPHALCKSISDVVGDRIGVVDLVLWRFAATERRYLSHFSVPRRRSAQRR